ncbi:MAG: NAD(P)H-binding protein [Bacteroidota bacterium]
MKITLTGSLGRIGTPLTQKLLEERHTITVISSNLARSQKIETLGAIPAIGRLQDTDFLAASFQDANAVYVMIPPANYFDHNLNLLEYFQELGNSFAQAIVQTKVKRVVNMSSIGAHLEKGNGILEGTHFVEQTLNNLPEDVAITHVRPTEIYYNLFQFINLIKNQGIMASNLAEGDCNAWVSPQDIADVVVEELAKSGSGRDVRYVASDELTYREVASTLGSAIGKPDLPWVKITDEQLKESLKGAGMKPEIAEGMVEMYAAIRSGLLYEDYKLHQPKILGQVKMKDFAKEFATVYNQQ